MNAILLTLRRLPNKQPSLLYRSPTAPCISSLYAPLYRNAVLAHKFPIGMLPYATDTTKESGKLGNEEKGDVTLETAKPAKRKYTRKTPIVKASEVTISEEAPKVVKTGVRGRPRKSPQVDPTQKAPVIDVAPPVLDEIPEILDTHDNPIVEDSFLSEALEDVELGPQPDIIDQPFHAELQSISDDLAGPAESSFATPPDYYSSKEFNVRDHQLNISALMQAGVHLGHTTARWNPKMAPYITGARDGIHLINLHRTIVLLRQSLNLIKETAKRNGIILFVGHQPSFKSLIMDAAKSCEQYFLVEKWIAGTLTNAAETLKSEKYLPDLIIFFDVLHHEKLGLKEAKDCKVVTIGICDTDCNPDLVTFPIPGNNDGIRAVGLYANLFSAAAKEGRVIGRQLGLIREDIQRDESRHYRREER